MAFAFTAFVPKYRCKIPLCDFPEFARYNDPRTGEAFTFVKTAIGSMGDGKKTLGMIHSIDFNNNFNSKFVGVLSNLSYVVYFDQCFGAVHSKR